MPYNSDDRGVYLSRIPQTNYQTATLPSITPKNFIEEVVTGEGFMKLTPKVTNNKGQSTGVRHATESWTTEWDSDGGYDFEVSAQNIGRYLHAALGATTSTTANGKTTHVHKPLDTAVAGLQMPAYSVVEQLAPSAGGVGKLWPVSYTHLTLPAKA